VRGKGRPGRARARRHTTTRIPQSRSIGLLLPLALLVNGGGIDGGNGAYLANCGDDVHAVGSLAPIIAGYIGCIVIKPDGSRYVARAVPDPGQQPD
jgi:hypothetical protein